MNKKFSTLVASVLLASGFSFSAQATAVPASLKVGDYVQLGIGGSTSTVLAFDSQKTLKGTTWSDLVSGNALASGVSFDDVNEALWRVEAITKADKTGSVSYRFVNKYTGEYLAIKLLTDNKGTSSAVAKLDATGNNEWSFDASGKMYAYDAAKDSTYYLDASYKLNAKKGVDASAAQEFTVQAPADFINLTAKGFNDLMGAQGNDGKLHFGNSKDVTTGEANAIKDVAWKAIAYGTVNTGTDLLFWNGKTQDGYANDLTGKKEFKKKEFLLVDTTYLDKSSKAFFALTADTLGWEPTVVTAGDALDKNNAFDDFTGVRAYATHRHPKTALFTAKMYLGNDSIVLVAKNLPKVQTVAGTPVPNFTAFTGDFDQLKDAALTATAEKTELKGALAILHAAYGAFKVLATGSNTITFATAYFNQTGTSASLTTDATHTVLGSGLVQAVTNKAAGIAAVGTYTGGFSSLDITTGSLTDYAAESINYTAADNATAENTVQKDAINALASAYVSFANAGLTSAETFVAANFDALNNYSSSLATTTGTALLAAVTLLEASSFKGGFSGVAYTAATTPQIPTSFHDGTNNLAVEATTNFGGQVVLRELSKTKVLTVTEANATSLTGYIEPLIQPFATMGGDAVIATNNLYFWQIKNEADPKVTDLFKVYTYVNNQGALTKEVASADTSAYNPATQWGVVKGATAGYYQIVNRETAAVKYVGPVFVVKDEDGEVIADTYVAGSDTLKLVAVDRSGLSFVTEKVNKVDVDFDYNGYFYAGSDNNLINRTFKISSASPYLNALYMQSKKDSVVVLGEDAVVWNLETVDKSANVYGAEITGIENLKRVLYNVSMTDADGNKYYVYNDTDNNVFSITKSDSQDAKDNKAVFYFKSVAKGQYLLVDTKTVGAWTKMTINPTPKQPIMEVSALTSEKNDYFTIEQTNLNVYRELGVTKADDGLMLAGVDSAKIFMENEPTRFLYENTINAVANNGNKVAKDSLNFLGIYNSAAAVKEAALFIDTAYVARADNYMPQYLIGLRQSYQEAGTIIDCPDKNPNCTDPSHRKETKAYRTADYLVSLSDSVPAGVKTHPSLYDGAYRLAFVPATHIGDSVIIANSKFTGTKQAKNDTLKIADNTLNKATFALRIKDQDTKSFYLETVGGTFVRILNGVPVLTDKLADAGVFNIEKTTEAPVANEAVNAAAVKVTTREGAVVITGAEGKKVVITNVLGQTIASTVITSSEATIAAPAGYVTVAVEGEAAVKAIVK